MASADKTATLIGWDRKHAWHPFTQQADWVKEEPLVIRSAKGVTLTDTRGRRYLDGVSSLWVTVHGHNHPVLNRAVKKQLTRMAHTTFLGLTHEPAIALARELAALAPRGLSRVFYSDNGATAVEVALKMAYQYHQQQDKGRGVKADRSEYLALAGSYHGDTLGAVSVGGTPLFHDRFKPLLFKAHFAMAPHCYRCPCRRNGYGGEIRQGRSFNGAAPRPGQTRARTGCRWECLKSVEEILKRRGNHVAAAIIEPINQGAAGMRVMPPGYLKGFERLCRKHGVLLIADEVATGFGRTGTLFAVEQERARPDLMCVAKSITGGYLPLAATLATERIYRAFLGRHEEFNAFFHGHTYTANPLACAAARANLELFKKARVLDNVRRQTARLSIFLEEMRSHPLVGDVRQAGLMAGLELVENKKAKKSFPPAMKMGQRVCLSARREGLWLRPLGDVVVLMPPLAINDKDMGRLLGGVRRAFEPSRWRQEFPALWAAPLRMAPGTDHWPEALAACRPESSAAGRAGRKAVDDVGRAL